LNAVFASKGEKIKRTVTSIMLALLLAVSACLVACAGQAPVGNDSQGLNPTSAAASVVASQSINGGAAQYYSEGGQTSAGTDPTTETYVPADAE